MNKPFGQILKDCRLGSGLGLRELARLIGKSPGYLSDRGLCRFALRDRLCYYYVGDTTARNAFNEERA